MREQELHTAPRQNQRCLYEQRGRYIRPYIPPTSRGADPIMKQILRLFSTPSSHLKAPKSSILWSCKFSAAPVRSLHAQAREYLPSSQPDFTDSQRTVREAIAKICRNFPDEYWLEVDESKRWPVEFTDAIAKDGWLGICMPSEYGGSDLGIAEVLCFCFPKFPFPHPHRARDGL